MSIFHLIHLMKGRLRICLISLWLLSGCSAVHADGSCIAADPSCPSLFIVHDAWHAAMVLSRKDIPADALPELSDFPEARFLEFSWGDKDYFPNPDAGVWSALRAAFWSGGSVLHVVGFTDGLENFYRGAAITELKLSLEAFNRLIAFLSQTFARPAPNGRAPATPGLFAYSRFYPAHGHFSLLRTCNTWVAEALETAGMPLSPRLVVTSGSLARQIAPYGKQH